MADKKKCAHPACSCMTDQKYCSPYCESHKDTAEIACECGHPGCRGDVNA
jgi:metallothionein